MATPPLAAGEPRSLMEPQTASDWAGTLGPNQLRANQCVTAGELAMKDIAKNARPVFHDTLSFLVSLFPLPFAQCDIIDTATGEYHARLLD